MISRSRVFLAGVVLAALSACSSINAVGAGESVAQKSYGLYGTFVVFEEQAAKLFQNPDVPPNVKQILSSADAAAKPVADELVNAVLGVDQLVKDVQNCHADPQITDCSTKEGQLRSAAASLDEVYFKAKPLIFALVSAVKGAR